MERDGIVLRSPRLAARRRDVTGARRRRHRRVVLAVVVTAAAVCAGFAFSRSELFELQSIEVVGARTVREEAVVAASGLALGQNALAIDPAAVAARVRASVPAVGSARIERVGSLGVRIFVTERLASAEVRAGKSRWWVDRDGTRLSRAQRGLDRLPVILVRSDATTVAPDALGGILTVWEALPARMRARARNFTFEPSAGLAFRVGSTAVSFGKVEQVSLKVGALRLVLRDVRARGRTARRVDLRAPGHPAVRIG